MKNQVFAPFASVILLALFVLLMPAQLVSANEIVVDKHCRLDQAIRSANNNSSKARCERGHREDTIILKKDLRILEELPEITSRIILDGNNHTLKVQARHPAFVINWGNLTIKDLTVKFEGHNRAGPTIEIKNGSVSIVDSHFLRCTGKFKVEDSLGEVKGDSTVCNYSAETVASWFDGAPPEPTPTPEPSALSTCDAFGANGPTVTATYGLTSGVHCKRVDAVGIANPSVTAAGYIDAIDVYGYVEQGVEICFRRLGAIIFLDAATTPRSRVPVEHFAREGGTCAWLNRPGTVVLAPGQPPVIATVEPVQAPVVEAAQPVQAAVVEQASSGQPASGACLVTTIANLKLRSIPFMDDNIIGYVPRGETLSRLGGNAYWHNVDYRGLVGWISGNPRYVQISGACG